MTTFVPGENQKKNYTPVDFQKKIYYQSKRLTYQYAKIPLMQSDFGKTSKITSRRIRLPVEIIEILEEEAKLYGFTLNEWLDYILTERAVHLTNQENNAKNFARKILMKYKLTPHHYPYINEQELKKVIDNIKKD